MRLDMNKPRRVFVGRGGVRKILDHEIVVIFFGHVLQGFSSFDHDF
jgi:hypothetical protein